MSVVMNNVSHATLKTVYFSYFHSVMRYGIIVWGSSAGLLTVFRAQKRAIRILAGLPPRSSCRPHFKALGILTAPALFILEILCHVRNNVVICVQEQLP